MDTTNIAEQGTTIGRFLAHRGVVVVKEFKDIGKLKGSYSSSISVTTLILAIVKGINREMTYGVKLEQNGVNTHSTSSVLLDFDELDELTAAFDFINFTATDLLRQQRDYTEVIYATKDNARFGFYQDNQQQQQAFVALTPRGDNAFIDAEQLLQLKKIIESAKEHLVSRGAGLS